MHTRNAAPAWFTLAAMLLAFGALAARPSGQARGPVEQGPTFRAGTRLVHVSVVVHDRNGNPVGDLAARDFTLLENGKAQRIELFSIETRSAAAAARQALPANTFSNRLDGVAGGTATVLLFDRLNTRYEDQQMARDQIVKVLAALQPTDRVALYVLESDRVRVLHDFTTDARGLVRVLSRYLAGMTSVALDAAEAAPPEFVKTGDAADDAEAEAWLKQTTEMVAAFYNERRGTSTTDALEAIAHRLAGIRGRKNLIWVSSAFPLVINDPKMGPRSLSPEIRRATRAINDADVAVYPVDTRGLIGAFASAPSARAQTFSTMSSIMPNMDTMKTIAEDTGGRAFVNTNAIGDAVRRAIDDSRITYTLGYYPSEVAWDGKFREITVKVNRRGLDLRHRKGYHAQPPPSAQPAASRADSLGGAIRNPLEATGIGLTARVDRPVGAPFTDATLTIHVDAGAITWDRRGDEWAGTLDLLVGQSEADGRFFKSLDTTVNLGANAERYAQMLSEGFTLTHTITLREGASRLHVVVRDAPSRTIGSLIIPASRIRE